VFFLQCRSLRECIKSVRFIFQCLAYYDIYRAKPSLAVLTDQEVLEKFLYVIKARGNGPIRIYKLLLAIRKAVTYVTKGSAKQSPSSSFLEKALKDYQKKKKQHQNRQYTCDPTYTLLSEDQYEQLRERCELFLTKAATLADPQKRAIAKEFMEHLILLTLVSVAPPRHQVFSFLEPRHLVWREDEKSYEIQMDGVDPGLKYGHPVLLLLPPALSVFYKSWIETFRRIYLNERTSNYVFPNTLGGRATKLSPGIEKLTKKYLKVVLPISKFRYDVKVFLDLLDV